MEIKFSDDDLFQSMFFLVGNIAPYFVSSIRCTAIKTLQNICLPVFFYHFYADAPAGPSLSSSVYFFVPDGSIGNNSLGSKSGAVKHPKTSHFLDR